MFPSGSFTMFFAVFPSVGLWCSQSVKFKKNQNDVLKITQSGTFRMFLTVFPQCAAFGTFWENSRKIARTFKMFPVFQFPGHTRCTGQFSTGWNCGRREWIFHTLFNRMRGHPFCPHYFTCKKDGGDTMKFLLWCMPAERDKPQEHFSTWQEGLISVTQLYKPFSHED